MMEWSSSYSVGVASMDWQHQQLFQYYNELHEAMLHNQGQAKVADVLQKLCRYVVVHFQAEELWMSQHGYPGLAEHRLEHQRFAKQAEQLMKDSLEGKLVLSGNICRMLREWLTNHIMGSDQKYAAFASKKGIRE